MFGRRSLDGGMKLNSDKENLDIGCPRQLSLIHPFPHIWSFASLTFETSEDTANFRYAIHAISQGSVTHSVLFTLFCIHKLTESRDWLVSLWLTGERLTVSLPPSEDRFSQPTTGSCFDSCLMVRSVIKCHLNHEPDDVDKSEEK